MGTVDDVRWLTDAEIDTWLKFRAVVELYPGVLDGQLRRDSDLTHMEYQVLAMLSEATTFTLRMTALSNRTNSTLTRMSHVVTRLEHRGLVERSRSPEDGRATNVTLTASGHATLVQAAPGHVTQVRASFLDALDAERLAQLDGICDAILDRIDPEAKMTAR
ncbi:MAG: MarR family transcriptional regulator [Propionibacteriaceae bacterium]|nr:MarR family transcriptional regulator [Propionibacteriaceae bacterium]